MAGYLRRVRCKPPDRTSEKLLFDPSQLQDQDRGHNTNARHAAEALFAPKRVTPEQSFRETPALRDEWVRKPRVLAISRTLPGPSQVQDIGPISPNQQIPPKIPRSQFARIRAWRRYGMTSKQVAEVYGVCIDEIERILR
jgi:hypothetical protein